MTTHFSICGKPVGEGEKALVIAEVAQAHDGSLGLAHSFIDAAAKAGADAIKFQTHIANAETTLEEDWRVKFSYEDKDRFSYWKRMEFTPEQWAGLKKHADEAGLIFLSSPFSADAIDILSNLDMGAWKVASGELTNLPLLRQIAKCQKPILLSSGMSTFDDLNHAINIVSRGNVPFGLFQCTSKYPTPLDEVGLNVLDDLRTRYRVPVGLSDHSARIWPSITAMARHACFVEVHVTFDPLMFGPDASSSLTFDSLRQLCQARDAIYHMDSNPVSKDQFAQNFGTMRSIFQKSVALKQSQPKGTRLTLDMLTIKKPGTGIPARQIEECVGSVLNREVSNREILKPEYLERT